MKKILWLPSWYPNKMDPLAGDFIQRHARAVALYQPVHIIFVIKDESGTTSEPTTIVEQNVNGNLAETIAYIKPFRVGIKPIDRIISIVRYIRVSRALVKQFIKKEGPPALVHVHVALWAGITALWMKRKFGIPYIITEHWTGYEKTGGDNVYKRDLIFRKNIKRVLKNTAVLLPVSNHLGQLIVNDFADVPYKVIPNAVNTQYFKFDQSSVPLFRFIHVSGMNYQKNAEGILACFSRLLLYNPRVELLMVGPADNELKLLATRLGLKNNIRWTGEIAYENVATELKHASCLLMFSRYENLPCAILEALCCGLPVIATRTGGIPEIVNSSNGIIVQSENENELLKAMIAMVDKIGDYDNLSISRTAIDNFNYEVVGAAIKNVYQSFL